MKTPRPLTVTALFLLMSCSSGSQQADGGDARDMGADAPTACSVHSLTCDQPDTICVALDFTDLDAGGICLPCGMPDQHCCPNGKSADQWRCPDGYACVLYFDTPPYCERSDGGPKSAG
jgi:hypothetical protein